jgi:hypothetical protein
LGLFARLETALARLEQRQAQGAAAHAADRDRLARLEAAAGDALKALDALIAQE